MRQTDVLLEGPSDQTAQPEQLTVSPWRAPELCLPQSQMDMRAKEKHQERSGEAAREAEPATGADVGIGKETEEVCWVGGGSSYSI